MPRGKKPAPTQPPMAENNQAYGERGAEIAAQEAIPLPQVQPPGNPAGGQETAVNPAEMGPGAQLAAPDPMQAALLAAMGTEPPTPFTGPTTRPDEPVTAGLSRGPGPGIEAVPLLNRPAPPSPTAQVLAAMARANRDNPVLAQLAADAQARRI